MNVKELMIGDKGVFHYINQYEELPFTTDIDVEILDLLFVSMYGNRRVSPMVESVVKSTLVEEDEMEKIAKMIHLYYAKRWNDLYEIFLKEIPLETYKMTTTETITDVESNRLEVTNEHNKSDVDKVSGFNSDVMVDDKTREYESTDSILNEGGRDNERQITKEVKGNQGNALKDREVAIKQAKEDILYNIVFRDVSGFVGLLMY